MGRGSSVGIATRYGLDGPGIASRWGRGFPHPSRPALGPTQPPIQWVPVLYRGYSNRGVALTTHLHLAPSLKKESAITLHYFWAFMAFSRVTYTFTFIFTSVLVYLNCGCFYKTAYSKLSFAYKNFPPVGQSLCVNTRMSHLPSNPPDFD